MYVRSKIGETQRLEVLRQQLALLDRGLVVFGNESMEQIVLRSIAGKRFTTMLLAVFAGFALIMSSIGIFGVLSYLVGQRTREIGLRMALGATRWEILVMILAGGIRLTLTGIGIGVLAALALTHLISSMLFGVKSTDVLTFAMVILALCSVALIACYLPARRAMKIDPMIALRDG
jgi:putative ABC transport system permease protein